VTRKPKLGRPPLGNAGRTSVLSLKVSADERRAWEAKAQADEVTLGAWIRERCNR
jgi:hypothetical protein